MAMSCPSTSSRVAVFLVFVVCGGAMLCSSFPNSFLTYTVLILSTLLLFQVTKRKPIISTGNDLASEELSVNTIQGEVPEEVTVEKQQLSSEEEDTTENEVGQIQNVATGGSHESSSSSESERIDRSLTSEDSEFDWQFPSEVRRGPTVCSDESISDDDSLIEIELPEVNYFGTKEEQTVKPRQNSTDFLPESKFPREELMDILAEINEVIEEENLIEIDLSVGSIKCSRLEIEA